MPMGRFATVLAILFATGVAAIGARAEILGEHGDWLASKASENGKPVCHLSAKPQKEEGDYSRRGDVYAIVTHRPAEDRVGEVSFQAGYTYRDGSNVTVTIDGQRQFDLFTNGGYAWTRGTEDDRRLIAAMKAGLDLVVQGTSSRGTLTTDTYSLSGFTAAYNAISKACGL